MAAVWAEPARELSGRDVANLLPEYAYTTIATVLDRLSHKGELLRRRSGNRVLFTAARTSGSHTAQAMREALDGAGEDAAAALADFVMHLPEEQRALLQRALEREQ
jgi:predicted transcriptional regulator